MSAPLRPMLHIKDRRTAAGSPGDAAFRHPHDLGWSRPVSAARIPENAASRTRTTVMAAGRANPLRSHPARTSPLPPFPVTARDPHRGHGLQVSRIHAPKGQPYLENTSPREHAGQYQGEHQSNEAADNGNAGKYTETRVSAFLNVTGWWNSRPDRSSAERRDWIPARART